MTRPSPLQWRRAIFLSSNRFYQGTTAARSTQYTTELYDRLREAQEIIASAKKRASEGARALIDANKEKLGAAKLLESASDDLSRFRKAQVAVMRGRSLNADDEKRARMNEINAQLNRLSKSVSERTEKAFGY